MGDVSGSESTVLEQVRLGWSRLGDFPAVSETRVAAILAGLAGDDAADPRAALDGTAGVEDAARLVRWLRELGEQMPASARLGWATALADCPDPQGAVLRVLDAEGEVRAQLLALPEPASFVLLASQSQAWGRRLAQRPSLLDVATERTTLDDALARAVTSRDEREIARAAQTLRWYRTAALGAVQRAEVMQAITLAESVAAISEIAETCIQTALALAMAAVSAGAPTTDMASLRLSVIGLGKLGSWELNPSSDVDLMVVYDPTVPNDEAADGYAMEITRRMSALLDDTTADGFVFRVDLRLRPFGTQGPVAMRRTAMLQYYETFGRGWERAVLLRARVVAGDVGVGERLLRGLRPFVFRKYLDHSALGELATMKASVDQAQRSKHARGAGGGYDVKLGAGGIREVEFFAQAFALVWGGREPSLAEGTTWRLLDAGTELGLVGDAERLQLLDAWAFLRLLEHRIQWDEDRQTQQLPTGALGMRRLAWRMGFASAASLLATLDRHREVVRAAWERLFANVAPDGSAVLPPWVQIAVDAVSQHEEARGAALHRQGWVDSGWAIRELDRLGKPPRPLVGPAARPEERDAVWQLLALCGRTTRPDRAWQRVVEVLWARAGRGSLLRLVGARERSALALVTVFAVTGDLGNILVRDAALLEALLTDAALPQLDRTALAARLQELVDNEDAKAGGAMRERRLHRMRRFRHGEELRAVLRGVGGRAPVREVTGALTDLAEVCLEATLAEAIADARLDGPGGAPDGAGASRFLGKEALAIDRVMAIGMGKLGGRELGHGADLDLLFVVDDDAATVGAWGRLVRKWVTFLSAPMVHGRLYPVDLRLRPDGGQGAVVTTAEGLAQYLEARAWPWERVALLRARPLTGGAAFRAHVDAAIDGVLLRTDADAVEADLLRLRERRLLDVRPGDFKACAGGLMDVEQFVQLQWLRVPAAIRQSYPRTGNTWGLLEQLRRTGPLSASEVQTLTRVVTAYREVERWVRLGAGDDASSLPRDAAARHALAGRLRGAGGRMDEDLDGWLMRQQTRVSEILAKWGWPGV